MEQLQGKHLLLDTNVLIESVKHIEDFKPFYQELRKYEITPCIDYAIKLEFLRGANTSEALEKKSKFLSLLLGDSNNIQELHIAKETFEDARRISNFYYYLNIKTQNNSPVDFLIGAQLKKYSNSGIFLATLNNKDFSHKLFDRVEIFNVETDEEIFTIGFYKFSEKKYKAVAERFNAS